MAGETPRSAEGNGHTRGFGRTSQSFDARGESRRVGIATQVREPERKLGARFQPQSIWLSVASPAFVPSAFRFSGSAGLTYPRTESAVYVITACPGTGTPNTVAGLKMLLSRLASTRDRVAWSSGPSSSW